MVINKPHGVFGFKSSGNEKLAVSMHDPNPVHLGLEFAKAIHVILYLDPNKIGLNSLRRHALHMKYRDDDDEDEPVTKCNNQLMRFLLCPKIIADHVYYTDGCNSVRNSMWCEWAYIFDFDSTELEIYRGGNKNSKAAGSYASIVHANGYCGVRLVATISLDKLTEGNIPELRDFLNDITYKTVKGKDLLGHGGQTNFSSKKYMGEEILVF